MPIHRVDSLVIHRASAWIVRSLTQGRWLNHAPAISGLPADHQRSGESGEGRRINRLIEGHPGSLTWAGRTGF